MGKDKVTGIFSFFSFFEKNSFRFSDDGLQFVDEMYSCNDIVCYKK